MAVEKHLMADSSDEETPIYSPFEDEINGYLQTKEKPNNPLIFWNSNQKKFPILSAIAFDIFNRQASSALSERIFTHSGKYNCYQRACMKPETLCSLTRIKSAKLLNEM